MIMIVKTRDVRFRSTGSRMVRVWARKSESFWSRDPRRLQWLRWRRWRRHYRRRLRIWSSIDDFFRISQSWFLPPFRWWRGKRWRISCPRIWGQPTNGSTIKEVWMMSAFIYQSCKLQIGLSIDQIPFGENYTIFLFFLWIFLGSWFVFAIWRL